MGDKPLDKLLELARSKASGELVCEAEGIEIHVYLQAGRVAWATDSRHPVAFRRYLMEIARVDEEGLKEVAAECRKTRAPLGETLVAWKLATPEQVREALRHQIGLAITALDQFSTTGKAVFLNRPQQTQYSASYTFEASEIVPPPGGTAAPVAASREAEPVAISASDAASQGGSKKGLVIGAVVVAALVVVGLVAKSMMAPKPTEGGQAVAASSSPTPAPGPAKPASGLTDTELVFGMAGPFSGSIKEMGRGMKVGIDCAFALANDAGGVNGRKVRLLALDDAYDPARTPVVMKELLETHRVFGIVGNVGTPTAAVAFPIAMEKKAVFFGALTGAPFLRKTPPDRYVFNFRPSYAEETAAAFRYLVDVRRISPANIAVFYQDDSYGQSGIAGVEQELRRLKLDPADLVRATYRRGTSDVRDALAVIKKERAKIKAIIMVPTYASATQFIQQVRDLGMSPVFVASSGATVNTLSEALISAGQNGNYTNDVIVTQVIPLPDSKATAALEYQAALEKYGAGEKPSYMSFEGFLIAKVLLEGVRKAGRNLDSEGLVSGLESLRDLDIGIGAPIHFDAGDHQASHKVWGVALQPDGKLKPIKLE